MTLLTTNNNITIVMEVVGFVQEMLQNVVEHAASYRLGQSVLRQIDRVLWTLEKSAQWAVPPPLDQDEHPQPELIRPLPWVVFLALLVVLRVTRESISLGNLVLGKPPLRSADVVTYIQGKRRYLRTLKYQGNRMMRARTKPTHPSHSWFSSLQSLFEFTMCFRRQPQNYGNNNTTRVSNNDEVFVVNRNNNGEKETSPVASASEDTMERLIEKMMVDLQTDSDDDSSYTSTNPMSLKSDPSEDGADSEQGTIPNDILPNESNLSEPHFNDSCQVATSTPEKDRFNYIEQSGKVNKVNNVHLLKIKEVNELVVEDNDKTRLETTSTVDVQHTNEVATSAKEETILLLQSEINITQNNKPQRPSKHMLGIENLLEPAETKA
ncbi:unnamed protein product [Parnassius apollo]|uniref:(apollo) hypothetical protein n=1 Tax=Parnassius apollo TaxID=110799 RepID=A0A8S3Y246_PARAO|nr:unnamed protein product [Parnassius apollo]